VVSEFKPPAFDIVKLPAMLLYARDFANPRVQRMSAAQRGIFILLLCQAWIDEGLDPDPESLAMAAAVTDEEFAECWKPPLSTAWEAGPDGRLRNRRQEKSRLEAQGERSKKAYAAWLRWHGADASHKRRTSTADGSQCNSTQIKSTQDSPSESRGAGKPRKPPRQSRAKNLESAIKQAEAPEHLHKPLAEYMDARKGGRLGVWSVDRWVKEIKLLAALEPDDAVRRCERACDKPWARVVYEDRLPANAQQTASQAPSRASWYKGPAVKPAELSRVEDEIRLRMAQEVGDFMLPDDEAQEMARQKGDHQRLMLDWKLGLREDRPEAK
jgi:uncharacterized protein YdaU (DUF1376 family)